MSPEQHRFARQLFEQALDLPEIQRDSYLQGACQGHPEVLDEANGLLLSHGQAQSFLDSVKTHPSPAIGRYRLTGKKLGRGGMGAVYEAIDPEINRKVAIKTINLEGLDHAEELRRCLVKEARLAGALNHPGIVVIHDMVEDYPCVYVIMELLDGPSLHQFLESNGVPEPAEALNILRQVAAALDYAHQKSVVHRDIKPRNIMFHEGKVKITDFGIATAALGIMPTQTAAGMGTPEYMSPEHIAMRPLDGRSDEFSLAVLAYQLFTGVNPFGGGTTAAIVHKIMDCPRPFARTLNPTLPPALDAALRRALDPLPEKRYATCSEFVTALEAAFPEKPTAVGHIRASYFVAGAAMCLLTLAGALYYVYDGRPLHQAAPPPPPVVATATHPADTTPGIVVAPPPPPFPATAPVASSKSDTPVNPPKASVAAKPPAPIPARDSPLPEVRNAIEEPGPREQAVASPGDAAALYRPGKRHETGAGTVQNVNEAIQLDRKAAVAGDAEAKTRLAQLPVASLRPPPKSPQPPLSVAPGGVALTVRADRPWTDTGMNLFAGDQVTVVASGLISVSAAGHIPPKAPGGFSPDCSAAQALYHALSGSFPAPRLPCWSLIGRLGGGNVFEIGARSVFQAAAAGRLFLGINDSTFEGHSGFWTAAVSVTHVR